MERLDLKAFQGFAFSNQRVGVNALRLGLVRSGRFRFALKLRLIGRKAGACLQAIQSVGGRRG